MKKQNRKLSNGARDMVRASEPAGAVVTAAGTSEGAKKGWESRIGSYVHLGFGGKGGAGFVGKLTKVEEDTAHIQNEEGRTFKGPIKHLSEMETHGYSAKATSTETEKETVKAKSVIHCKASGSPLQTKKVWAVDQPIEFMWMPGGVHTINASYGRSDGDQRPIELTVLASEEGAQQVQSAFEAIRAASPRRPPFICIEHQAKERAGEPLEFFWKTDPEPAIYCRCAPSELGCRNVNGKIHTSFSPTFDTDAEYHKMECTDCRKTPAVCACESGAGWRFPEGARGSRSLPARVTAPDVQSVGSLTNWNAFRDMLPIAARETAVMAAGTSEGAKKAWETRKHGANSLSQKAAGMSALARKIQDAHAHDAAAYHHAQAAKAHKEAANHAPDKEQEEFHRNRAVVHKKNAESHAQLADLANDDPPPGVGASDTEEQKETIQAAGSTEPLSAESILAKHAQEQVSADSVLAKARQRALGLEGKVVQAGGTSEGAKKGWEHRAKLHDAAYQSSDKAFYATKIAHEPDTAGRINADAIHKAAAEAHQAAASARRDLAAETTGRDRDHHLSQAEDHERHASSHLTAMERHRGVTKFKASATEEQKEMVQAAGTSEGARKGWESRMNHTTAANELDKTIDHHLKKGWMEKDDPDHIHLTAISKMLRRGHPDMAMKMTDHVDTAVRETIPPHVWHHMGGELTPRGTAEAKAHLSKIGALVEHKFRSKASDTEEQKETVQAGSTEPLTAESILARVGQSGRPPANQTRAENQ